MRVLCAGDLHMGRRPSRLPTSVDPASISPTVVWQAIVDHAIAQQADVVALSGDVVDRDNRYYESLGPLERGLRRLAAEGIVTVAVAGNHDYAVLPEVVRSLPEGSVRLLGVGGRWERTTIERGGQRLHVDGWSFPDAHVRDNPLAAYAPPPVSDAPVLGLLHADLEAPASPYAPVTLADLQARSVALWLLGHVHAPALHRREVGVPVLYPGSPQPLDPGEPGPHGVWMVTLAHGMPVEPQHVRLATVRYEAVGVDVDGAEDLAAVRVRINERVGRTAEEAAAAGAALRHLSLRLRLVGRTAAHRALHGQVPQMVGDLARELDAVQVHIERIEVATRPARDLEAIAAGSDAAGQLARLLIALDRGDDAVDPALWKTVAAVPQRLAAAKPYRQLAPREDEIDGAALRAVLSRQAARLLDEMIAGTEVSA